MTPDEFDWVTALGECSVAKVFEKLRLQVGDDIETRNKMVIKSEDFGWPGKFSLHQNGAKFSVLLEGRQLMQRVTFTCNGKVISVTDTHGKPILSAIPALDRDGHCIVLINGEDFSLWRMRMKALQHLFFEFI